MVIIFSKGKQVSYFPEKKNQIIEIPLQKKILESGKKKEVDPGDKIVIDKVFRRDEEFGQPYLPIKLIGEVVKNIKKKKKLGMKYKKKKRTKKIWGYRTRYTLIKIVAIEG